MARKPNAAFMKPLTPSAALAEVVGSKALPRTEVTKKLWVYIKKNKLQDPKNRGNINQNTSGIRLLLIQHKRGNHYFLGCGSLH
jgi:chromatin remodeling complex protein RSC6